MLNVLGEEIISQIHAVQCPSTEPYEDTHKCALYSCLFISFVISTRVRIWLSSRILDHKGLVPLIFALVVYFLHVFLCGIMKKR